MYVALLVVVWIGGGPEAFGFAAAFALFALGVCVYLSLIRQTAVVTYSVPRREKRTPPPSAPSRTDTPRAQR